MVFWWFQEEYKLISILKNFAIFRGKHQYGVSLRIQSICGKTPTQVFSSEYCEIFNNIFFEEHQRTAASSFNPFSSSVTFLYSLKIKVFWRWKWHRNVKCDTGLKWVSTWQQKHNATNIYLFKVTTSTLEEGVLEEDVQSSGVFIVNFEHMLHLFLVFLLQTLSE